MTLPAVHGESVVIRILDKDSVVLELDKLGMAEHERDALPAAPSSRPTARCSSPGPTGSGKSTSLYAALGELNTPEKNIITIEDPVEYQLEGITQVQVNPKAGLTFATGLRSMMRADPDIIMVGEIRDRETAQIAIEAALTGHLVLSTLHTNDAPTAITRLIEMGIEPFLVASAIDCVVAQRLARTLCQHCKQRDDHHRARSCATTASTSRSTSRPTSPWAARAAAARGYKGRIGLYEVMLIDRRDPRAGDRARARPTRSREVADARGHAPPARRRPGEGQAGPHVDRRGRARHRHA